MSFRNIAIFVCFAIALTATSSALFAKSSNQKIKLRKLKYTPNTRVVARPSIGAVGATVTLKGYLYSTKIGKKRPLKGKILSFRMGKKELGKAKTNRKGKASIKFKVPERIGARKFTVIFSGGKGNTPSRDSAKLNVIKSATKITAKEVASKSVAQVTLRGVLTRTTDGKGLAAREVVATVNGTTVARASTLDSGKYELVFNVQTYVRKTISVVNGKKIVRMIKSRVFPHPYVEFKGNKLYTTCGAKAKIKKSALSKKPVSISVNCGRNSAKIGDRMMFTVIVRPRRGSEPVAQKTVYFMGQQKKTSGLGSVAFFHTIKNTGKLGPRELKATTKEDDKYRAGEGKVTLDVSTR